jgi:DNA-binding beta-propeller fold protein YncE
VTTCEVQSLKLPNYKGIIPLSILICVFTSSAYCLEPNLIFQFAVSRLNDGTALRDPLALDVSKESGEVFVSDTGNNRVLIFNAEGVLTKTVGTQSELRSPIGVAVAPDGDFYVTEMQGSRMKHFDLTGSPLPPILLDSRHEPAPLLGRITAGKDGVIYAVDRARPRVFVILAGEQTREMNHPGVEGTEWKVQDITADEAGNVYVLSSQGVAVTVLDRDGKLLRSFGLYGPREHEFSFPTGMCIGPDDNLWIVDSFKQELKVFSLAGEFLFRWGRTGPGEGELFYPVDVAFGERTLYVLEKGASRLQAFRLSER